MIVRRGVRGSHIVDIRIRTRAATIAWTLVIGANAAAQHAGPDLNTARAGALHAGAIVVDTYDARTQR